jgi:hypothetical protein
MRDTTFVLGGLGLLAATAALMAASRTAAATATAPTFTPGSAAAAAEKLLLLLQSTLPATWGTKAAPNAAIAQSQRAMGGLVADGIYGAKTKARGEALTAKLFPVRPSVTVPTVTIPAHAVQVLSAPAPAAALPANTVNVGPAVITQVAPLPDAPGPSGRSPKQAAQALRDFAANAIRSGDDAALGSKASPSDTVANAQRDMRLIASDGVYGPKTQARGKELLGIEFPKRARAAPAAPKIIKELPLAPSEVLAQPLPVPPATAIAVNDHSPVEAANALLALLGATAQGTWGTKKAPNELIQKAQADMGGLVADGIYGPKTQKRGAALTGAKWPTRK